jgi:hypothetical protein
MMREPTEYEKEKWYDEYDRFLEMEEDDFLSYGDELGEAFISVYSCTRMEDYGLSDWFVKAAQIQCLDMYYDQILVYTDEYGGNKEPEDLGLPSEDEFIAKWKELGVKTLAYWDEPRSDAERKLWDWAMEWREEHYEEWELNHERKFHENALARLTEGNG